MFKFKKVEFEYCYCHYLIGFVLLVVLACIFNVSAVGAADTGVVVKTVSESRLEYKAPLEVTVKEALLGSVEAQLALGDMYYRGIQVEQDYTKAFMWYKKAAVAGSGEACNALGNMYRNGIGVKKNKKSAVEYYKKAALAGHAGASGNLGRIYLHGTMGEKKDRCKAFKLLCYSAKKGDRDSLNSLGYMYEKGFGTERDYAKAARLYKLAIKKGDKAAAKGLKRVQRKLKK